MDSYEQRIRSSRKLAISRLESLALFIFVFLLEIILLVLSYSHEKLIDAALFPLLLFFGFSLQYLHTRIFLRQIKDSFDRMQLNFSVGRRMSYTLPISNEIGDSFIWESIRARTLYRYRYHSKAVDFNFIPVDSGDPASCAWSAAWFYINDDIKNFPYDYSLSNDSAPLPLIEFALNLGQYGLQHDFISDIALETWLSDFRAKYNQCTAVSKLLKSISV